MFRSDDLMLARLCTTNRRLHASINRRMAQPAQRNRLGAAPIQAFVTVDLMSFSQSLRARSTSGSSGIAFEQVN
jgi:hypothetical protein